MWCPARQAVFTIMACGPLVGAGCAGNPFRTAASSAPLSLEPPPGVAAPAHALPGGAPLPQAPSYADVDGRQLEGMLTRSRQESQVLQDEVVALRDQLASTSARCPRETCV